MKNRMNEARRKAIFKRVLELRNQIKGFYSYSLKDPCTDATIRLFLFECAQQANSNEITKHGIISACGKEIVDMALELFPDATIEDNIN